MLHIHPDLQIQGLGDGVLVLPGLELPGQHRVIPEPLHIPTGPVQLDFSA